MELIMMTGATGFVGERLAHQLLDHGYNLRLLVRSPAKAQSLEDRGATLIQGDLNDLDSIRRSCAGVDGVFHLAAAYVLGGELEWMREVNVAGTRNVLDVAREADVERILYCGSDTSLGDTNGRVCNESRDHDGTFRSNYEQTKYESHQLVESRMKKGEPIVHAVVSSVYGPGDESPLSDLIQMHLAGHAVAYLDRDAGYTFTHIEDVATALRLIYEEGSDGERYLVSGEPATFEDFFRTLSEQTGIPEPRFEVPGWLIDIVTSLLEAGASLFGKSNTTFNEMITMGRNITRFFSSEKLQDEVDWNPRSLSRGMKETLPWYETQETHKVQRLLSAARYPLLGLAAFDLALGATAVFMPDRYSSLMHSRIPETLYLLPRTGTLWLVFAGVQGVAGFNPQNNRTWVLAAGVLRLMDVPADPVYFLSTNNLSRLGKFGLASAPIFNLMTGGFFFYAGYRGLRALSYET